MNNCKIIRKGNFFVFNLKNHWTGFKQIAIVVCVMIALISMFFSPILTQSVSAQSSSQTVMRAASAQKLQVISDRFDSLEKLVYTQNWNDIDTYIHGQFGEIRRELRMIAGQLGKLQKETVNDLANSLFKNFVKLDNAAKARKAIAAESAFTDALKDFESIVNIAN